MTPKTSHILAKCTLFRDISAADLDVILNRLTLFHADKGRIIIESGEVTTDVFFLLSGGAVGQLVAENGKEILFTDIPLGGCFGEMATLDGQPRSIKISTSKKSELARLSGDEFRRMLLDFPQTAVNLATDLGQRVRLMNDRLFGLIVQDVETRLRMFLMQLAQQQGQLIDGGIIEATPTHETMASYIGSNREAVSRAIAKLNKSGVISATRKSITLIDLGRLMDGVDP